MITIQLTEKQVATMLKLGILEVLMGLIQAAEEDAPKVIKPIKEVKGHVETVVKTEEAPADQEDVTPEPIATKPAEVHYDVVKASVAEKAAAGKKAELRDIFTKHGGTKLSDIPAENLQALYTEVIAL